jgi:hypothetical protein
MKLPMIALAAALGAGGAHAAEPAGGLPPGQCLLTAEMGRHTVVDANTLLVNAVGRSRGVYRFTMSNGCLRSAISSDPLSLQQVGGGRICKPSDVVLRIRSGPCAIQSIEKLTAEEAAALPRKLKP